MFSRSEWRVNKSVAFSMILCPNQEGEGVEGSGTFPKMELDTFHMTCE